MRRTTELVTGVRVALRYIVYLQFVAADACKVTASGRTTLEAAVNAMMVGVTHIGGTGAIHQLSSVRPKLEVYNADKVMSTSQLRYLMKYHTRKPSCLTSAILSTDQERVQEKTRASFQLEYVNHQTFSHTWTSAEHT